MSVKNNPYCSEGAAKDAIDAVWDICYNDTRPFDRAPWNLFRTWDTLAILCTPALIFWDPSETCISATCVSKVQKFSAVAKACCIPRWVCTHCNDLIRVIQFFYTISRQSLINYKRKVCWWRAYSEGNCCWCWCVLPLCLLASTRGNASPRVRECPLKFSNQPSRSVKLEITE
jgi:hypothetical protein